MNCMVLHEYGIIPLAKIFDIVYRCEDPTVELCLSNLLDYY